MPNYVSTAVNRLRRYIQLGLQLAWVELRQTYSACVWTWFANPTIRSPAVYPSSGCVGMRVVTGNRPPSRQESADFPGFIFARPDTGAIPACFVAPGNGPFYVFLRGGTEPPLLHPDLPVSPQRGSPPGRTWGSALALIRAPPGRSLRTKDSDGIGLTRPTRRHIACGYAGDAKEHSHKALN
jgi:hypothetical protein